MHKRKKENTHIHYKLDNHLACDIKNVLNTHKLLLGKRFFKSWVCQKAKQNKKHVEIATSSMAIEFVVILQ